MHRLSRVSALCCATAAIVLAAFSVGSGAPNAAVLSSFMDAYDRGGFSALVLAPTSNVGPLGSPGLVQTFQWAANTSLTAALVAPDASGTVTLQMYPDLYAYFSSVGASTAGYPTTDTTACPFNTYGACNYQLFAKNYALFVYSMVTTPGVTPSSGVSYSVSDPFYTEWSIAGGVSGSVGPAISSTTAVTSQAGTQGTQQLFGGGAIYSYTVTGAAAASNYNVSGAIYTAYAAGGGFATLGFPTAEQVLLTGGQLRQVFENGNIFWTPAGGAVVSLPIKTIQITSASSTLTLALGQTATLTATATDTLGNPATGRTLTWSTSNGNAVTVQSSGYTAVITAVGAGSARIQVTGEGKTSAAINVTVAGQCCVIGAGAPSQAISQAFQAAAARNNLSVLLPNPTQVVQSGGGYIQTLTAADGSGAVSVIAESNTSAIAWVLSGPIYAAYVANGGFSGPLGYPTSDASAGGTQSFASGAALAGSPVRLVPVPIAAKWIASGAETGPLGPPAGTATVFTTYSGINGNAQTFGNGTIFGIASGSRAGQAFISSGLILARYLALSGPAGLLGSPLTDVFTSGAVLRENFETGYIDLQPGAAAAVEHYNPLNPSITAAPSTVAPGGKVHVAISGFAFGSSLNVSMTGQSITGQTNFVVKAPGGEFGWDILVPAAAKTGAVTIQATAAPTITASVAYTVVPLAQLHPVLTVVSGDQQTGAPGAALASPLIALLSDSSGNPLPGVPVSFSVSPGASATVSAVTGANGQISAALRLQPATGIALLSVSAAAQTVTFGAISSSKTLTGFPAFTQTSPQGSLVAALAAAIAWYQNAGALTATNGRATPAAVNQYLAANGGFTPSETGTSIANPWVAMQFAGIAGGISVEPANLPHIVDLLNAGSPLVLELNVLVDGTPAGAAAVNAIGIGADGTIAIADPNPVFGQTSLSGYLSGFSAQGHSIQATLSGVIRIVPALTAPAGFVSAAAASSAPSAASPAGPCSNSIDVADGALAGQPAPTKVGAVRFLECDGTQPVYQLAFGTQNGAIVIDLGGGPVQTITAGTAVAWQVTRVKGALTIAPQTIAITAVVNAAGFQPGLAPGEIVAIFGAGFTAGPAVPTLTLNGKPMQVLAAFPFQVNAVIPIAATPGSAAMTISSPLGAVSQSVTILPVAPGIFAVENQNGALNSASNPAQRGTSVSIYGTGLGATTAAGSLQVVVGGTTVTPSFAGSAPGFTGLDQINVQLPPDIAPGSAVALTLTQAGQTSNTVAIAVQ